MMKRLFTMCLIFAAALTGALFTVKAQEKNTDSGKFASPVDLLSSYYESINEKEYKRAYGFWRSPDESLENFAKGFAETAKIRLIVEPPASVEGAAGSLYAQVPAVLISTMTDGKKRMLAGCYTLHKSNLRPPDIPEEDAWRIYRAELRNVSADAKIPPLLDAACPENAGTPPEKGASRVLGVIGTEDESISVPAAVEANKDFEITVTTTGSGCVSAADTGVVLGESGADVFVYDFTTANRPGVACTMIFKTLPHKATLRFTKKGEATIRIWGRRQGGASPFGEPVVIEKRVTVR